MPVVGIPGEVKASATTVVRFLCDFVGLNPKAALYAVSVNILSHWLHFVRGGRQPLYR